jgi:hypothetical protein
MLKLGLGTGRFGRVLARSATRPVLIGFEIFQPVIVREIWKTGGYSAVRIGFFWSG